MTFLNKYILNDSKNWIIDKDILRLLLWEIDNNPNMDSNNLKGRLGEIYVAECLKRQLYNYGFKYSYKAKPMTFRMRYQYPQGKAVDIYLRVIDKKGNPHKMLIECCNWGAYSNLNWYMYLTRIEFKFFKWDWRERYHHIVAMNRRNVHLIEDKASQFGTHIIPLREHITPDFVQRIKDNNMASKEWIEGFRAGRKSRYG